MAVQKQTAGLAFPVQLVDGKHTLTEGLELIKSSIKIILSWPLRTRKFNGEFGSRIFETIEEPNDDVLMALVRRFTLDALGKWESRIELISMDISRDMDKLNINLVYKVKDLDIQDSLFYNYYIN